MTTTSGIRPVRLLTIHGPHSSGDFVVAADVYNADLATLLAEMLGEQPEPGWQLTTPNGQHLPLTSNLARLGVQDGQALRLVPNTSIKMSLPRTQE